MRKKKSLEINKLLEGQSQKVKGRKWWWPEFNAVNKGMEERLSKAKIRFLEKANQINPSLETVKVKKSEKLNTLAWVKMWVIMYVQQVTKTPKGIKNTFRPTKLNNMWK